MSADAELIAQLRARAEKAETEVDAWKLASGLECGGDPDGVTPTMLGDRLRAADERAAHYELQSAEGWGKYRREKAVRRGVEAESGSLLRRLQLIAEAAETYDHAEGCTFDGNTGCTCVLALVDVDVSLAPSGAAVLERLQAAEASTVRMEQDRDEWRTKAMDVNTHPAVVVLKRERDAALHDVQTQVSHLTSIRREFERRDMDPQDIVQTVRALLESHRRHLIGHREEKAARARAEANCAALRRAMDLAGHAVGGGDVAIAEQLLATALREFPVGAALLERLRAAEAVVEKARTVTCAKAVEDVDLDMLIDEYDAATDEHPTEVPHG